MIRNKKQKMIILVAILAISIMSICGCSNLKDETLKTETKETETKHTAIIVDKKDDSSENNENSKMDTNEVDNFSSENQKSYSFDEYVAGYTAKTDISALENLRKEYESITNKYNDGSLSKEEYNSQLNDFDNKLRENNINVPFPNLEAYLSSIKNVEEKDKKFLLENEEILMSQDETQIDLSQENAEKIFDKADKILEKYSVNFDEVVNEIVNMNYQYALFNIDGDNISQDDKAANTNNINENTKDLYINTIKKIKLFIPKALWDKIVKVEFNTDGSDNVLAHTVQENEDGSKFRLALDVNDTFDKNGKLTKDGIETIIHKFGHVLTLNDTQMTSAEYFGVDDVEFNEKYKKEAYISKFYNKFWKKIYKESKNQEPSEAGETTEFYQKYKEQFVSDYASTNPEEDIAETFRVFVINEKPEGNIIKDQKVKFLYNFKGLVKCRNIIRNSL